MSMDVKNGGDRIKDVFVEDAVVGRKPQVMIVTELADQGNYI